jgi:hypothetical protein
VQRFDDVNKKAVANANIRLCYDSGTGFFGSAVKSGDRELKVSEYDKVLVVTVDGTYQIINPPEKTVIEGKVIHLAVFDPEQGFRCLIAYRDQAKHAWGKQVHIKSFITGKVYDLAKNAGKLDVFVPLTGDGAPSLVLHLSDGPRGGKGGTITVPLRDIPESAPATRGAKLDDRVVTRITQG